MISLTVYRIEEEHSEDSIITLALRATVAQHIL